MSTPTPSDRPDDQPPPPAATPDRGTRSDRNAMPDRAAESARGQAPAPGGSSAAEVTEAPRKPGFVRHLLGVLVGLALTPFAFLLAGIGGARLADIAGTTRMGTDILGVTLLAVGVVLLAVLVLLGAWSPAVPLAGGVVWGLVLGIAYLVSPRAVEDTVDQAAGGRAVPAAVDQFAQSAMSGMLLLIGVLLVAAGLAAAFARRAGRRWAEATAAAELARLESEAASTRTV
jgi:hypothetical protein